MQQITFLFKIVARFYIYRTNPPLYYISGMLSWISTPYFCIYRTNTPLYYISGMVTCMCTPLYLQDKHPTVLRIWHGNMHLYTKLLCFPGQTPHCITYLPLLYEYVHHTFVFTGQTPHCITDLAWYHGSVQCTVCCRAGN